MTWRHDLVSSARHHGNIGVEKRVKIKPGGQGHRQYSDELVALIKLELQTNSVSEVATFHDVSYRWVYQVGIGTIRAEVKASEAV